MEKKALEGRAAVCSSTSPKLQKSSSAANGGVIFSVGGRGILPQLKTPPQY